MTRTSLSISRIALLGCNERVTEQINKVTNRMGLSCQLFDENSSRLLNVIIIDIANVYHQGFDLPKWSQPPSIVGLITHGTPTEIERAIALGATAVIHKPIHQGGLFTALTLAQQLQTKHSKVVNELDNLRQRHDMRPLVIKATTLVMSRYKVEVDEALSMLRNLSMQHNQPIEQLCERLVNELSEPNLMQR